MRTDATVWCHHRDCFWVFTGRRDDWRYVEAQGARFDLSVSERGSTQAVIAVQGEISRRTIERCFPDVALATIPWFGFQRAVFGDAECWIARIGYSGETGFELVIADAAAPSLWQALLAAGQDAGLVECGFDAIDSLRIEAGHILFTRELASRVTPAELGFARWVDLHEREFCGGQALRARRRQNPPRRLAGLLPAHDDESTPGLPAHLADGDAVMTSMCWSPLLERRIGIGFVAVRDARAGTRVRLVTGSRATVARLPFYDPCKMLPRRA